MVWLCLGLLVFLGTHSVRIFADGWRGEQLARRGEATWKGLYSLLSGLGLVLIVVGYGQARAVQADLWIAPIWMRHITALLMLPVFVLLTAAYVPGNRIRARLKHPMVLSVKLWAFAHLLCNARPAELLLFGSFLLWAVLDFRSARARPMPSGPATSAGSASRDAVVLLIGLLAWIGFAFWGHQALIGVAPFAHVSHGG
jgi:uncharacterized membrane protein